MSMALNSIILVEKLKGTVKPIIKFLMDFRDSPFVRTQTESVTFLSSNGKNSKQLCSIPFMDYVSHSDVLPYSNTDLNTPLEK